MFIAIIIFVVLPACLGIILTGPGQIDSLDPLDDHIKDLYHGREE